MDVRLLPCEFFLRSAPRRPPCPRSRSGQGSLRPSPSTGAISAEPTSTAAAISRNQNRHHRRLPRAEAASLPRHERTPTRLQPMGDVGASASADLDADTPTNCCVSPLSQKSSASNAFAILAVWRHRGSLSCVCGPRLTVQRLDAVLGHPARAREPDELPLLVPRTAVICRPCQGWLFTSRAAIIPLTWQFGGAQRGILVNRTPEPDRYLSVMEVAEQLGFSDQTIHNWIRDKKLPARQDPTQLSDQAIGRRPARRGTWHHRPGHRRGLAAGMTLRPRAFRRLAEASRR